MEEDLLKNNVNENNTPVINLPTSSPSKPKRRPILLLIILILLIVCCGFGFYQVHQSHTSQKAIQPSVHPTNAVLNETQAEEQAKIFLQKSLSLSGAKYVAIPGTDLEIQVPTAYKTQPIEADNMLSETMLLNYKSDLPSSLQATLKNTPVWWGDFRVGMIQTNLTPQEWVLDNVVSQGIKLKDEPSSGSRGTSITIHGNTFLMLNTGCCSAAYFVYFLPYINTAGQKSILVFATHNNLGAEDKAEQRNVVLDTIVATLRKTQTTFFTIDQWHIRLPIDKSLSGIIAGKTATPAYSQSDLAVPILAPQLDTNWTCSPNPDGTKADIGMISRTSSNKRAGPYQPLITKKIGNYTYGFEATLTSNCTKDPKYKELVTKFKTAFSSLEAY